MSYAVEPGSWQVETAEIVGELRQVRERITTATTVAVVGAAILSIGCGLIDLRLAVLPLAFVLGWLNLAGL